MATCVEAPTESFPGDRARGVAVKVSHFLFRCRMSLGERCFEIETDSRPILARLTSYRFNFWRCCGPFIAPLFYAPMRGSERPRVQAGFLHGASPPVASPRLGSTPETPRCRGSDLGELGMSSTCQHILSVYLSQDSPICHRVYFSQSQTPLPSGVVQTWTLLDEGWGWPHFPRALRRCCGHFLLREGKCLLHPRSRVRQQVRTRAQTGWIQNDPDPAEFCEGLCPEQVARKGCVGTRARALCRSVLRRTPQQRLRSGAQAFGMPGFGQSLLTVASSSGAMRPRPTWQARNRPCKCTHTPICCFL